MQVKVQDHEIRPGDPVQIHGPTTGVVELSVGELWRDDEYEVDLDKVYEEIAERLSSKMTVRRTAYDYYYSENVKVFVNDNVRFELVREVPLRILELWVNDYDTDVESGFWVAPDRLDVFCDMAEYVQNNYETYEKRARAHADKMLKEN